jgi:hypothetical protein
MISLGETFSRSAGMPKGLKQKTSGDWLSLLLVGIAFFVTGLLVFFFFGLPEIAKKRQLDRDGVIAEAVVLRRDLKKAGNSSSTQCWLTYHFEAGQGYGIEARTTVSPGDWEDWKEGGHLQVRYLPRDPHLHQLLLEGSSSSMLASLVLSGAFALAGVVISFISYKKRQAWRGAAQGEHGSSPDANLSSGSLAQIGGKFNSFVDSLGFGVVFGGVFLLAGVCCLLVSANQVYQEYQLRKAGQVIQGKVLAKYMSTGSHYRGNRSKQNLFSGITRSVMYRFTTPQGLHFDRQVEVDTESWAALQEQEPVQVLFLPQNPSVNRLAGKMSWGLVITFGLVGGIFTVVGIVVTVLFSGKLATRRTLTHQGVTAQGTVLAVENEGVGQSVIHYQYFDARGRIRKGHSGYLSEEEADLWKVGDTGIIRFNPRRPTQSVWEGKNPQGC